MELGMNGGSVLQSIGLELLYRVDNKTQIDIVNGDLVSFDGADGNSGKINIKKARPGENPNHILGVATENIFQGESGFVTWFGKCLVCTGFGRSKFDRITGIVICRYLRLCSIPQCRHQD